MLAELAIATAWTLCSPARHRESRSTSPTTGEAWSESASCSTNVVPPTGNADSTHSQSATEARADQRSEHELRYLILAALTKSPGLDDVAIAEQIGAVPVDVSRALRAMAVEGLVEAD